MLSLMRKHAGTWIIKVILGAIVVVFVFWGVGSYTTQRSSRVASVNGDWITLDNYQTAYNNLLEQVRQTFGNNLNDDLLKSLQLRKRALDQLIDNTLMLQAAEKLQMAVSDEELAQSIRELNSFQTAGVFDRRRYMNILNSNKLTPEAFEVIQRDALLINKLRAFITGTVKVSDQEALEWYKWKNSKLSIDYVLFETSRYKDLTPTEEELKEFFERNQTAYKTEPKVKARYIVFKPESYNSQVTLSDAEVQDYYEANLEEFKTPKTVEARHVLIKVEQDASAEKVAEAKEKIENILKMAKEGKDFAELAKEYSEGPSKDRGGYLGTFQKESMVKPFADKAFSMNAGEISEPVRTRFGWHIIKVEKVNPATTRSLAEAKSEIQKKLIDEQSKILAYEDAEGVYDASFEGGDLETIAGSRNLAILETDFFSRQGGPKEALKNSTQFAAVAFDLVDSEVSEIQDFGDGYYLLQVIGRIPGEIPELKSVVEKVTADWIKERQEQKAREDATQILTDLNNGQTLDTAAQKFALTPKSTEFFKRDDSIPDIGSEPEMVRIAFGLSEEKKLPEEPVKGQKGYYVIRFRERQPAAMEGFDKQKAEIKENLLRQKKFKTFDAWLLETRKNSEISLAEGFQES